MLRRAPIAAAVLAAALATTVLAGCGGSAADRAADPAAASASPTPTDTRRQLDAAFVQQALAQLRRPEVVRLEAHELDRSGRELPADPVLWLRRGAGAPDVRLHEATPSPADDHEPDPFFEVVVTGADHSYVKVAGVAPWFDVPTAQVRHDDAPRTIQATVDVLSDQAQRAAHDGFADYAFPYAFSSAFQQWGSDRVDGHHVTVWHADVDVDASRKLPGLTTFQQQLLAHVDPTELSVEYALDAGGFPRRIDVVTVGIHHRTVLAPDAAAHHFDVPSPASVQPRPPGTGG